MNPAAIPVQTPIGTFTVSVHDDAVHRIRLPGDEGPMHVPPPGARPLLDEAAAQIQEYVAGTRRALTFPVHDASTPFQAAVREAMQVIPYGTTRTYAAVAAAVGRPGGARAVGQACRANPLPIAVPCHRVVASDGSLGGFMGRDGIALKRRLLELEEERAG